MIKSLSVNPKSVPAGVGRKRNIMLLAFLLLTLSFRIQGQPKEELFSYLRSLGNGSWLFGQMATWVHNENPDMDNSTNFPELAGFVFWSDDPFYNVIGNINRPSFIADPKIITLF